MTSRRTPLPRQSQPKRISDKKLKENGGRIPFSTITAPKKAIKKENVEATRKRRFRNQKRMRSPEYKAAKAGAMKRAGGRCEFVTEITHPLRMASSVLLIRCEEINRLQFHEERYRKVGPVTADDGKIFCPPHHRLAEKAKPHKWHRRGF